MQENIEKKNMKTYNDQICLLSNSWQTKLFKHFVKDGRLFQQYLVDAYATVEDDHLEYVRKNQGDVRSKIRKGIFRN